MKYASLKILALFSTIVIFSPAKADYRESSDMYYDKAKVLSATPIYKTVVVSNPREVCRNVSVPHSGKGYEATGYKSATPIVLGSIVGAAVGSQFGRGKGKTVGTIAGGVLGGAVARDVQYRYRNQVGIFGNRNSHGNGHGNTNTRTECDTYTDTHEEQRPDGYQVKYRYKGRVFQTRMTNDPGHKLPIKVSVVPTSY